MVDSTKPYLKIIRETLDFALNLRFFPSLEYEKIIRPQVEVEEKAKELLMKPITIARYENEKVEIESSINSVRINILTNKTDLESLLSGIFYKFLMNRADKLNIFRKVAKPGFDVSFLITDSHLKTYKKEEIIDVIIGFISDLDNDIINMKMIVNSQLRLASNNLLEKLKH